MSAFSSSRMMYVTSESMFILSIFSFRSGAAFPAKSERSGVGVNFL